MAENYVELAKILGVTRRTLQNWRKRPDAPKPMANGFHDVAAWREFMARNYDAKKTEPKITELLAQNLITEKDGPLGAPPPGPPMSIRTDRPALAVYASAAGGPEGARAARRRSGPSATSTCGSSTGSPSR